MNILITGVKREMLAKIKELVKEEGKETANMEDLKDTVGEIDNLMERIYKMRPDLKPKKPVEDTRPFDDTRIDGEYNLLAGK